MNPVQTDVDAPAKTIVAADSGAHHIAQHPEAIVKLPMETEDTPLDIGTPAMLRGSNTLRGKPTR